MIFLKFNNFYSTLRSLVSQKIIDPNPSGWWWYYYYSCCCMHHPIFPFSQVYSQGMTDFWVPREWSYIYMPATPFLPTTLRFITLFVQVLVFNPTLDKKQIKRESWLRNEKKKLRLNFRRIFLSLKESTQLR